MVQISQDIELTLDERLFADTRLGRGWVTKTFDNGWTITAYLERDLVISSFMAICEDGLVVKLSDGTFDSTSETIFQDFLEEFELK
jgi:hypothetical protein